MKDAKSLVMMLIAGLGLSAFATHFQKASASPLLPAGRRFSARGIAMLKQEEGFLATPKLDVTKLAIGYGHNIVLGDGFHSKSVITPEQAHDLLLKDVLPVEKVLARVTVPLNANQYDALVLLGYNIGTGALEKSTLLKKLNAGDYVGARAEFHVWNKAGGRVNPVLVGRRQREANLFAAGV